MFTGGMFGCASGPVTDENRADKNDVAFYRKLDEDKKHVVMRPDDFFHKLVQWDQEECVIAASTSGECFCTLVLPGNIYAILILQFTPDYGSMTHLLPGEVSASVVFFVASSSLLLLLCRQRRGRVHRCARPRSGPRILCH